MLSSSGDVQLRVTLLAAGFVIGPAGSSVREVMMMILLSHSLSLSSRARAPLFRSVCSCLAACACCGLVPLPLLPLSSRRVWSPDPFCVPRSKHTQVSPVSPSRRYSYSSSPPPFLLSFLPGGPLQQQKRTNRLARPRAPRCSLGPREAPAPAPGASPARRASSASRARGGRSSPRWRSSSW